MKKLLFILLLSSCYSVSASELKSDEAKALIKELKHSISVTAAKIVELEKRAGVSESSINIELQQAGENSSLGLVLNEKGTVLLVTPYSEAAKLGLISGDQIKTLTVDGIVQELSKPVKLSDGQELSASIERNKEQVTLNRTVSGLNDLAWSLKISSESDVETISAEELDPSACGQVSVFVIPPVAKDYYPVFINSIDKKNIISSRKIVRLKPGKHLIKVNELIDTKGLTIRRPNFVKGKFLEIEVEANKSYHLAAEFDRTKRFKTHGEEYWKPIVWKVTDKKCEL